MPDFLKAIGAARFGVMAGVAAALTAFFLYIAGAISEAPKAILFSGLEMRDAFAVTAKLESLNVPYEAKGDGGTILVPADQVTTLRMQLAAENLPAAGVGYEIFDKSDTFGTTAFVQDINRLRALEGELSRSIQTISGVVSARVHLVIPERQIFSRDSQQPTASVVLKTRGVLDRGQVLAVQHLVAAAVSALTPEHVAIVDDKGDLLAGGDGKTGMGGASTGKDAAANDYEERMRARIESLVSSIVGVGKVRVQVSADMNYRNTSETSETFDPDSKVVRSTQTVAQSATDNSGSGGTAVSVAAALPGAQNAGGGEGGSNKSDSNRTEETTNYEISKKVTTSTIEGGELKKLSVAVAVDGVSTPKSDGTFDYKPRSAEEMKQIDALVKSAIGYDKARGDQVEIANMPFARLDAGAGTPAPEGFMGLDTQDIIKIIQTALLAIGAVLVGLFVVKPLIGRMFSPVTISTMMPALSGPGGAVAGALPAPSGNSGDPNAPGQLTGSGMNSLGAPQGQSIDVSGIEGKVRESSIRKVGEVVNAHPDEALAILRTWLHQPV